MTGFVKFISMAVLMGLAFSLVVGTAFIGFWIGDRVLPVEVLNTEVVTKTVKPGGKFVIQQNLRYLRNCGAHVDRWLYDSAPSPHRKQLQDVDYERPPRGLGEKSITFSEDVPEEFVPGPAYYIANPVYNCNIIHKLFWPIDRPGTVVLFQIQR